LADFNSNDIPDCCEQGTPCVVGIYPVEWLPADGGNSHWYQTAITDQPISWVGAYKAAESAGGHLATLHSASENQLVFELSVQNAGAWSCESDCWGPWLGAFQDFLSSDYSEPNGGWRWVTNEPWNFAAWATWLPNNAEGTQHYLHYYGDPYVINPVAPGPTWDDAPLQSSAIRSYMIEWDSDCNNDGVVDFGQIRAGALPDVNLNNIPDGCECLADIFVDGQVNGADLGVVLSQWGLGAGAASDINRDGVVNGADLAAVLGHWGPCGG
jgi:hypothetical protein